MLIRIENRQNLRRAAFTLMEMLVVVAIIVALAGMGGYYVIGQLNESKVSTAKIKASSIDRAIKTYYIDVGDYPQQLTDLLQKTQTGTGPYLTKQDDLLDPWGRPYQYDPSGQKNSQFNQVVGVVTPDVYTTTPDGRTVGNWSDTKK